MACSPAENCSTTIFVDFRCRDLRLAVPLESVRRAYPAALPRPVPGSPAALLGVLQLENQAVAVLDLAVRAGMPLAPIHPSQQLLLLDLRGFALALLVDAVGGTVEHKLPRLPPSGEQLLGSNFLKSFLIHEDGLCLVCDPERFLLDEERRLLLDSLELDAHAC